jgi:hypothetical protein
MAKDHRRARTSALSLVVLIFWTGARIQSSAAAINPTKFALGYLDGKIPSDPFCTHQGDARGNFN